MNGKFEVIQEESCEWFKDVLQAVSKANDKMLRFPEE